MNKVILDTDIFSEILRERNLQILSQGAAYLARFERYTISALTVMEIVKGWQRLQRVDSLWKFLESLRRAETLPVDFAVAELAGRIYGNLQRNGQLIGFADTIIAATALENDLVLVTGNQVHYQRVQGLGYDLKLENWRD